MYWPSLARHNIDIGQFRTINFAATTYQCARDLENIYRYIYCLTRRSLGPFVLAAVLANARHVWQLFAVTSPLSSQFYGGET